MRVGAADEDEQIGCSRVTRTQTPLTPRYNGGCTATPRSLRSLLCMNFDGFHSIQKMREHPVIPKNGQIRGRGSLHCRRFNSFHSIETLREYE